MDVATISGAASMIGGAGLVGFIAKQFIAEKFAESRARREAWEAHIKACGEKNTAIALLQDNIGRLEKRIDSEAKVRRWIGDGVQKIADRLEIELPARPD